MTDSPTNSDTKDFTDSLDTNSRTGTVTITTDDNDEPTIVVDLSGVGADQEITVTPVSLPFGPQDVNDGPTAALTVTIFNSGLLPLHLTGAQVSLSGAEFDIDSDTGEATIAPGASRTIGITFDPATAGVKTGTLTITSDDTSEPVVHVSLSGTGTGSGEPGENAVGGVWKLYE